MDKTELYRLVVVTKWANKIRTFEFFDDAYHAYRDAVYNKNSDTVCIFLSSALGNIMLGDDNTMVSEGE